MAKLIPEEQLPEELTPMAAVEAAYPAELSRAVEALVRGLPVLLECDKGMVGYFYSCLRGRLRQQQIRCTYIDGRAAPQPGQMPMGLVQTMIGQLRDAVRGGVQGDNEQRHVMVLPHLDLLTTSSGGLTSEAREVVALLYENPNILWLGFIAKGPSCDPFFGTDGFHGGDHTVVATSLGIQHTFTVDLVTGRVRE